MKSVAGDPAGYSYGGVAILDGPNAGKPAAPGVQGFTAYQPQDEGTLKRNVYGGYLSLEVNYPTNSKARYCWSRRALFRLRLDRHRQAVGALRLHPGGSDSRHRQQRLPRAVSGPDGILQHHRDLGRRHPIRYPHLPGQSRGSAGAR